HLPPQRPEPPPEHVAHVVLEDQLVPLDAVQLELLLQHAPHLLGRPGDDAQPRIPALAQLADQRRGAGHGHLLVGGLQRGPHQLAERVEVRLQVRLVQVPPVDALGRWRIDAVRQAQRGRPSRMAAARFADTAFAATLPALAMALDFERPCALMKSWSNPSTGAPPYCSQSVIDFRRLMPEESMATPARGAWTCRRSGRCPPPSLLRLPASSDKRSRRSRRSR